MPRFLLPAAVGCHGAQSTSTGGSSRKNGNTRSTIAWFAHHMRCVLITAFRVPVEPEGERDLTIVSGPVRARARGGGRRGRGGAAPAQGAGGWGAGGERAGGGGGGRGAGPPGGPRPTRTAGGGGGGGGGPPPTGAGGTALPTVVGERRAGPRR